MARAPEGRARVAGVAGLRAGDTRGNPATPAAQDALARCGRRAFREKGPRGPGDHARAGRQGPRASQSPPRERRRTSARWIAGGTLPPPLVSLSHLHWRARRGPGRRGEHDPGDTGLRVAQLDSAPADRTISVLGNVGQKIEKLELNGDDRDHPACVLLTRNRPYGLHDARACLRYRGWFLLEANVDQFYEKAGSLFVEAYDAFYSASRPQIAGDVAFYERLAREGSGPVLEIGCGTGRIAVPLAQAGLDVTGVDRSEAMLAVARRKFAALPTSVQAHVSLVNQDMTTLNLGRCFSFVFVPFRSFQHVLTID